MKRTLLIIGILCLVIMTQAQRNEEIDIIGLVQNEAGEPLVGATVLSSNGGYFISGTSTYDNGIYELIAKGEQIEISYLGYQSIKQKVQYFQDNPIITMKERANVLDEVVVVAKSNLMIEERGCCHIPMKQEPLELNIGFSPTTWQVYPNPTLQRITVNTIFSSGVFRLLSSDGRILKTIPIHELSMDIDLSEYPAASYFLRYESDHWSETFGPIVKIQY